MTFATNWQNLVEWLIYMFAVKGRFCFLIWMNHEKTFCFSKLEMPLLYLKTFTSVEGVRINRIFLNEQTKVRVTRFIWDYLAHLSLITTKHRKIYYFRFLLKDLVLQKYKFVIFWKIDIDLSVPSLFMTNVNYI